jgi:hypothetical protein
MIEERIRELLRYYPPADGDKERNPTAFIVVGWIMPRVLRCDAG